MKPSASFIFDAKIIWKQYRQFHSVFTWNSGKIKNKNKDGFCWNLIFYIKQGNKSRVVNCSLIKYHFLRKVVQTERVSSFIKKIWNSLQFHYCKKKNIYFFFANIQQTSAHIHHCWNSCAWGLPDYYYCFQ